MNIAFISYEYPEETGGGGIGTYLFNTVSLIRKLGHNAIVICATLKDKPFWEQEHIYRIPCKNNNNFNIEVVKYFSSLHDKFNFDIIEGTDFKGWGYTIKEKFPEIPYVVRLHTPNYLIDLLQFIPLTGLKKMRFIIACLLRGKKPKLSSNVNIANYQEEIKALNLADKLITPTLSIAEKLKELGLINSNKKIDYVPFIIENKASYSNIKAREKLINPQIVFIGRHEIRKGVIELANSIPLVLKKFPNSHFTFVGSPSFSPNSKLNMIEFLQHRLSAFKNNVTFIGKVPHEEIFSFLELGDIFVFPSHYESFGLVCTEAMASGKSVIGSKNGGMVEILDNGNCGLLTTSDPIEISKNIIKLIADNSLRLKLGSKARERIHSFYSPDNIIPLQIKSYQNAINEKLNNQM